MSKNIYEKYKKQEYAEVALVTRISEFYFPLKTMMWFQGGGVSVSEDYGADTVVLFDPVISEE